MPNTPESSKTKKENTLMQKLVSIYSKYQLLIWLSVILVPIILITLGCIILPELFYDRFIWRYFWGTIEADAKEESYGEVTEAYNPINTIFIVSSRSCTFKKEVVHPIHCSIRPEDSRRCSV